MRLPPATDPLEESLLNKFLAVSAIVDPVQQKKKGRTKRREVSDDLTSKTQTKQRNESRISCE
jgi:hypothetical protein